MTWPKLTATFLFLFAFLGAIVAAFQLRDRYRAWAQQYPRRAQMGTYALAGAALCAASVGVTLLVLSRQGQGHLFKTPPGLSEATNSHTPSPTIQNPPTSIMQSSEAQPSTSSKRKPDSLAVTPPLPSSAQKDIKANVSERAGNTQISADNNVQVGGAADSCTQNNIGSNGNNQYCVPKAIEISIMQAAEIRRAELNTSGLKGQIVIDYELAAIYAPSFIERLASIFAGSEVDVRIGSSALLLGTSGPPYPGFAYENLNPRNNDLATWLVTQLVQQKVLSIPIPATRGDPRLPATDDLHIVLRRQ